MKEKPVILVVGSINMDLVMRTSRMPAPGETITGTDFSTNPGGKGANQAVAAARLGGQVHMIARVGDDAFSKDLMEKMQAEGIDCDGIMTTPRCPTGAAMIIVDSKGENSIVLNGGANMKLTPDDVFHHSGLFAKADILLLQMEIPLPTIRAAAELAKRNRCKIILDPAPAPKCMCDELFEVDIISPNSVEAEMLMGKNSNEENAEKQIASELIQRGAKAAVLKLGAKGALVVTNDGDIHNIKAYKVDIQDTTGAGDTFTGALAVAVGCEKPLDEAAKFACAAGSLACTKLGAQSAIPRIEEVLMLMSDQPQ